MKFRFFIIKADYTQVNSDLTELETDLGAIRYYVFINPAYTDATIHNMIQDYYGQIPNGIIALCKYVPNGGTYCALVQKTIMDHGSYLMFGYGGFGKGALVAGKWTTSPL